MKLGPALHAVRIALGSLVAYRLRTFLTALGIVIGVATVIAVEGVIEGLNVAFRDQISVLGTGTLYVSRQPWVILSDWWKFVSRPKLTTADARFLEERLTLPKAVVPFIHHRSEVQIGGSVLFGIRIIGTNERYPEISGLEPVRGRFLTPADSEAARQVAVIGAEIVDVLRKEGIEIGDHIRVNGRKLEVIGEMPSRGSTFGVTQDDFVLMPMTLFERIYGPHRSVTIGVLYDPDDVLRGEDEIVGAMRLRHGLTAETENTFSINSQELLLDLYRTLTQSLYATAIGLGLLTLLVGGVGIMNIMLVAVAERTQEIGIRKALGARPSVILTQFVVEASLVSGLGGALGTVLGVLGARIVARTTPLPATVSIEAVITGILFGFFVGVVFGFLPAYRAASLAPVDALRAE